MGGNSVLFLPVFTTIGNVMEDLEFIYFILLRAPKMIIKHSVTKWTRMGCRGKHCLTADE